MMRKAANIYWLGVKELRSFLRRFRSAGIGGLCIFAGRHLAGAKQFAGAYIMPRSRSSMRTTRSSRAESLMRSFRRCSSCPADRRAGYHSCNEQRKIYLRDRYSAELRTVCSGRTPTRASDQRRCDRDDAGGAWLRLCAADHHHRDSGFPLPCGGSERHRR